MNIPNLLTLCRIFLVPLLVILLIYGRSLEALIIFIIAGLTDALDGMIARMFNQRTELGAYLDPIADKLLITASYLTLAITGTIPAWLSVLVISRDIVILTGLALLFVNSIPFIVRPTFIGKISTFSQILTIMLALSASFLPLTSINLLYAGIFATSASTVISGIHYVLIGIRHWEVHKLAEN